MAEFDPNGLDKVDVFNQVDVTEQPPEQVDVFGDPGFLYSPKRSVEQGQADHNILGEDSPGEESLTSDYMQGHDIARNKRVASETELQETTQRLAKMDQVFRERDPTLDISDEEVRS